MRAAVVLLTRDLRVHDHRPLAAAAASADRVVPLFVLDDGILGTAAAAPNRVGFLLESLRELQARLPLVVRRGDVVAEAARVVAETGAGALHLSADVSAYAQHRERRLRELPVEVVAHPGVTVQPPGDLAPAGKTYYELFSPYWRAWRRLPAGDPLPAVRLEGDRALPSGALPSVELPPLPPGRSHDVAPGGEEEGRRRLRDWARGGLARYADGRGGLDEGGTSRLRPYLRFGCVSPRDVLAQTGGTPGSDAFHRQLCWRDFYAQLLAARPELAREDLRPRLAPAARDDAALEAWETGRTGYPLVDAGMRQLQREGWMANRARLVAASFLTKHLGLDWRLGARRFSDLLVDGDVAQNTGNWQWAAGTGADPRPYRVLNPTLQGRKLDPAGAYVRRYVPELAEVPDPYEPGLLAPGYPQPLVDHAQAVAAFRARRS